MGHFLKKQKLGHLSRKEFFKLPTNQKKRHFVAYLLRRGVSLNEATLICYRKFYHGDPFEEQGEE